ncbi:hypothetical protein Tco_0971942 [Tanacetum coccineum]
MEKIVLIKQRMQAAQDRQKSYADQKRKLMEFKVGDMVMLKVSPWKGVVRFGKRGKLNTKITIGTFKGVSQGRNVTSDEPSHAVRRNSQLPISSSFVDEPVKSVNGDQTI